MKKEIGVQVFDKNKGRAVVWAPFCRKVELKVLEPEQKILELKKDAWGYWVSDVEVEVGSLYKFVLDNETERPDPASLSQPHGVHGPSCVVRFDQAIWTDHQWKNIPLGKMIIYELHVGTFTSEGTFQAIIPKLQYLKQLGINAIEIMPIAQFPGTRNWGYDGVYPFAVQDSYGGALGLQELVNACHNEGIAVVLDVVYNHMGPEGNYLSDFGPYFTDKYHTPWGMALNFDDAWCDGVRNFFIQNALMWFRDFHIDALRLDAVHAIKDLSAKHILKELVEETEKLSDELGIRKYLIAECDLNDAKYIQPHAIGGYGLHAQWIDEFHHAIHAVATGERAGYYADFGQLDHLRRGFTEAFIYNGQYSLHRNKTFGNDASDRPFSQFVVFSQNHDQVGNRMKGDRLSTLISFEALKLAAGTVIMSPFIPLLFMGEEYGETNPFQYFVSHTDEDLVEAVRKGRKSEFKAFHDSDETPDPQSEETFNNSRLGWDLEKGRSITMLNYYKELIKIRKENPVFFDYNRKNLNAICSDNKILYVHKMSAEQELFLAINFNKQNIFETHHIAGKGNWIKILDSADQNWSGPGSEMPFTFSNKLDTNIKAESLSVYLRVIGFYDYEKATVSEDQSH
jgi:maltooligosyltrehalose trehalohydrolase